MKILRVPFTLADWKLVGRDFDSDDPVKQKRVLEILVGWRVKLAAWHSSGAEASEALLRARLADVGGPEAWLTRENARLLYAFAVTRFVNFANEMGLRRQHRRDMAGAAEQVGVERWLVQMRHDIVHNKIPPLAELRSASAYAVGWLVERYWALGVDEAMGLGEQEESDHHSARLRLHLLFTAFETLRMRQLTAQDGTQPSGSGQTSEPADEPQDDRSDEEKLTELLTELKTQLDERPEQFLSLLCSEGHLVLNEEQLGTAEWSLSGGPREFVTPLPFLQKVWRPVIELLHSSGAIRDLLPLLMARCASSGGTSRTQLKAWAYLVVQAFHDQAAMFNWRLVLEAMMAAPGVHERATLRLVMAAHEPPLKRDRRAELERRLERAAAAAEAAEEDGEVQEVEGEEEAEGDLDDWAPARGDWGRTPFGLVPGQDPATLSLLL